MATVSEFRLRSGRRAELLLLLLSVLLGAGAFILVELNAGSGSWTRIAIWTAALVVLAVGANAAMRRWARWADPVILPVALALNAIGVAMIFRIDWYYESVGKATDFGRSQAFSSILGIILALGLIAALRDHRLLRRFTYTAGAAGIIALMLPLIPGLGREINGARIWISLLGRSLQPGEFAKILLVIFFAGYLVSNRDTLALAGPKFLGMRFPRLRDLGPLLLVWGVAMVVQIAERDLGASLLLFGIFVAMLYLATERVSWVFIGLGLFVLGAVLAGSVFGHVGSRYDAWLNALEPAVYDSGRSYQIVQGLFGLASGGLFGTGLGEGSPGIVPFAESDFIVASLGEELGLTGLMAILSLYLILGQRAMRAAIGVRDGFGKLLAAGLGFAIVLQLFVVVGGVTRVIPLTGLTTPLLAYGGSAVLANWLVIALLLRVSNLARQPATEVTV